MLRPARARKPEKVGPWGVWRRPSKNAEKHGIHVVFGTSRHSRLGPRSEPSRERAPCKEPCDFQGGHGRQP